MSLEGALHSPHGNPSLEGARDWVLCGVIPEVIYGSLEVSPDSWPVKLAWNQLRAGSQKRDI